MVLNRNFELPTMSPDQDSCHEVIKRHKTFQNFWKFSNKENQNDHCISDRSLNTKRNLTMRDEKIQLGKKKTTNSETTNYHDNSPNEFFNFFPIFFNLLVQPSVCF